MTFRILMLDNEFPPLGGGTGTVNEKIIRELAKYEDIEIDLITSSLTKDQYEQENYLPGVRIIKVPVDSHNIHHSSNRELLTYAARALLTAIKLVRVNRYDICLAFCTVPAGAVALGIWALFRIPFLVRVSGPDIPGFEERYARATRLLEPVIRLIWRKAEQVIVKCAHEERLVKKAYPNAQTVTIRNGVDVRRFLSARRKHLELLEANRKIRLLCVARLIERKGQHHILEAVRLLKDRGISNFEVMLVGRGDAEEALKTQAQQLQIEDAVVFKGYVAREEIVNVYAGSDVFVLPSFNEGMSVATLEAIGAGLPLLVTEKSGLEELVDQNGYTFRWGDVDGLADVMEKLIVTNTLREEFGARSTQIASLFDWQDIGADYFDLLVSQRTSAENRLGRQMVKA